MLSAHAYNLVITPKPVYSLMNQTETCIFNDNYDDSMREISLSQRWKRGLSSGYITLSICRYKVQLAQLTCIIVVIYRLRFMLP